MHSLTLKKVRETLKEQLKKGNWRTVLGCPGNISSWVTEQLALCGELELTPPREAGTLKGPCPQREGRLENSLPASRRRQEGSLGAVQSGYVLGVECLLGNPSPQGHLYVGLRLKCILSASSRKPQAKKRTQTSAPGW